MSVKWAPFCVSKEAGEKKKFDGRKKMDQDKVQAKKGPFANVFFVYATHLFVCLVGH